LYAFLSDILSDEFILKTFDFWVLFLLYMYIFETMAHCSLLAMSMFLYLKNVELFECDDIILSIWLGRYLYRLSFPENIFLMVHGRSNNTIFMLSCTPFDLILTIEYGFVLDNTKISTRKIHLAFQFWYIIISPRFKKKQIR
jgi:hypothetical protein